jgi:hypothetical protein
MMQGGRRRYTGKIANMKNQPNHRLVDGEPGGARTRDHRIKSAMLYQLSYRPDQGKWNGPLL